MLSIGLAGGHAETIEGGSITHYDRRIRPRYSEPIEGGYVSVKTALLDVKPRLAVGSPLYRGSLAVGRRDAFRTAGDSLVVQAIAGEPENPACRLARLAILAPKRGAFDEAAPDVYAAWWRQYAPASPGAWTTHGVG